MDDPQDNITELVRRTRMDAEFKARKAKHEEERRVKNRPAQRLKSRRYEQRNPAKISVRKALMWAVKQGHVIKAERCAFNSHNCFGRIEGHHWLGYEWENRFEVIWLCHKHHQMIEFGELTLSPNIRPIVNFTK